MKTEFFQEQVLGQIKENLRTNGASLERLRRIAEDALTAAQCHGEHISNEAVLDFLKSNPEVEGRLVLIMEKEDQEARDTLVEHIRELLSSNNS
ncbi:hypothetical protein KJZ71_03415 [Patescibacteria group bacterium]|uniref:Uncharacterized protein n=1 Tax=candidate division WWE3 bacterium TaxID=2053526 RepID=A0A928Y6N0_UNCKA|nr:hypothetical protein [candidate division WWE3 bacterium]MCL4732822.1 hypothetical protein [Patescibacteria group bacterium]